MYRHPITAEASETTIDKSTGVTFSPKPGVHSIWAARVPFIPSFSSNDFSQVSGEQSSGRIGKIIHRQFRFIYDLASAKDNRATFELRFIARPGKKRHNQPTPIEIVFLGKTFHALKKKSRDFALQLWEKFYSNYPLEDPFNYPLEPVGEEQFMDYYEPIPYDTLGPDNVVEILKYEDLPIISPDRKVAIGDYIVHPFVPALDFSAMARFLETLSRQQVNCFASISLRPTPLFKEEEVYTREMIGRFRYLASETNLVANDLIREGLKRSAEDADNRRRNIAARSEYSRSRAQLGQAIYETLLKEKEHLFLVKVHIVSQENMPTSLVEALGSELMNNAHNAFPGKWEMVKPTQDSLPEVLNNLRLMEHIPSADTEATPQLTRLRYLVGAKEACGAFRLPIPPESGYLPGLSVKDEPFVLPPDITANPTKSSDDEHDEEISLGTVLHRGLDTEVDFMLSVKDLKRHGLITGSTGSGKTNTCLHLLTQLWQYEIGFLVIYPIDKPEYRFLMADQCIKEKLLIFTLGDETTAPFRFNPFAVPPKVLLKTHISHLMRCFMAAFSMWDPLPAIYRAALRKIYIDKGWDLEKDGGCRNSEAFPTMDDFYKAIVKVGKELTGDYDSEVQGNIRQGSEIRLRDLLENVGHILNVQADGTVWEDILVRPTVMELGRIGSTEDSALIMGFLLTSLSAELVSRQKRLEYETSPSNEQPVTEPFQHFTLIEEAHRLMPAQTGSSHEFLGDPRAKGGEDFSNILAEVRGYGEGILIAEQIPTTLVAGAVGNTYLKVMHWLEDKGSFELFCDIMNLNKQQREYARTLQTGQSIVRSRTGRPVLVQVAPYMRQYEDREARVDISDEAVRKFMSKRLEFEHVFPKNNMDLNRNHPALTTTGDVATEIIEEELIPLIGTRPWGKACHFCLAVGCPYPDEILALPWNDEMPRRLYDAINSKELVDWPGLRGICSEALTIGSEHKRKAYCFLARWLFVAGWDEDPDANPEYWPVLEQFEEEYDGE